MASEIKLPELGENLTSGDVLDVRVAPGDMVSQGQTLLELEAEKSTVEVPSPVAGRIAKLLVKKGETIHVGQTLCLIEESPTDRNGGAKVAAVRESPSAEREPEPLQAAKRESDLSAPRPQQREIEKADAHKTKKASAPPERREIEGEPSVPTRRSEAKEPAGDGNHHAPAEHPAAARLVPAGPATRRLARELGVQLERVLGSAPGGRVTQEDIKAYVRDLASGAGSRSGQVQQPPLPDFSRWGEVERRPLDGVRRKTAEQMSLAWSLVPHVTQHEQADVTDLEAFRKQQDGKGPKLTVTAFVLKAAAIALRQFPQFNSSLDWGAGLLVLKHYYHIGVAVDTERGLLVPVVRDVDKKSVHELASELAEVAERARQKKIQPEEMRGGSFTVTNLGGIGGTAFTPIVNYPEVAILGLSRSRLQPVVRDGQIVPRLLLPLSLSYDHRVIDGADAARFARRLADMLENPLVMLLDA